MSKTKWYTKPIRRCERSVAILVALALVLSLGIVAVPMAGKAEAQTELVGSFSRTYQTTTTSTDFYLAIGLAAAVYVPEHEVWPGGPVIPAYWGADMAIGGAPTYNLFQGMTPGAFLFEDIQFGSSSEGQTYTISSVSDDPDFDDFAAFLTNGTDDNIWEAWIWPMDSVNAGGIRCNPLSLDDPNGLLDESDVFSGTDVGTDFPGYVIQSVSLTFDDIYTVHSGDFDWLTMDYTVDIYASPPPLEVEIDIKPGSDPNSINPKSKGKIAVAILSTADFDAPQEVDKESLTFGKTGGEESLAFCTKSAEDVNGDGLLDQVCHFYTQSAEFECGDEWGYLKGQTVDGMPIEGSDSVRIVPCK